MSRTTLCAMTALALVLASIGLMGTRYAVLGNNIKVPNSPGTWKIVMLVNGKTTGSGSSLLTATPLDFGHQHVLRESCHSHEMLEKPPDVRHPERRQVLWIQRSGMPEGAFRVSYEFYAVVDVHHPTAPMSALAKNLYAPPRPGEQLDAASRAGTDSERISVLARRLTANVERPEDQAEALFRYVDKTITDEPSLGGPAVSAADCLKNGSGDSGGKSRLLVALLRNRGIPARLVTGLTLTRGQEQLAHHWVETWIHDRWLPMCPFYHHLGRVPPTYLVFGFGDVPVVRGRHLRDLDYAFLVERTASDDAASASMSVPERLLAALSFHALPPAEQRLIEFLLLLPIAALMVCVYRNVIGLNSFGTFAPALVGLAFRDLHSLPGMLIFVSIVLVGWVMRRFLDHYHLLQVPRTAFLLSLVVIMLIGTVIAANFRNPPLAATQYVSLFPMVILTGMIERFWTLECEDSTASSFKALLGTMFIAASIGLVLSLRTVVDHMFSFPETLGIIMAIQLLLGRYTGYKLSELYRFRDFIRTAQA